MAGPSMNATVGTCKRVISATGRRSDDPYAGWGVDGLRTTLGQPAQIATGAER